MYVHAQCQDLFFKFITFYSSVIALEFQNYGFPD